MGANYQEVTISSNHGVEQLFKRVSEDLVDAKLAYRENLISDCKLQISRDLKEHLSHVALNYSLIVCGNFMSMTLIYILTSNFFPNIPICSNNNPEYPPIFLVPLFLSYFLISLAIVPILYLEQLRPLKILLTFDVTLFFGLLCYFIYFLVTSFSTCPFAKVILITEGSLLAGLVLFASINLLLDRCASKEALNNRYAQVIKALEDREV